jgi:3-deoxy-D-manno-octulosonic-acid transferase
MWLTSYRVATSCARPFAPLLLGFRERRRGKEGAPLLAQRAGPANIKRLAGRLAWFHAASVGETNAVLRG